MRYRFILVVANWQRLPPEAMTLNFLGQFLKKS